MKLALMLVVAAGALFGQTADTASDAVEKNAIEANNAAVADQSADLNVNSRYIIESISFTDAKPYKLSSSVLEEMQRLVGSKLNSEALNRLAQSICGELRAHTVTFRIARGGEPESIKVILEVDGGSSTFDVSVPTFVYSSREGWNGTAEAAITQGSNALTLDLLSNGDTTIERRTGLQARYDRLWRGADKLRLSFEFDTYSQQYNSATLLALDNNLSSSLGAGAYRSFMNFQPSAAFVLAKPLTLTIGFSFEQLQHDFSAAPSESDNAMIDTLRYHQRWDSDSTTQELDAGYNLRAATRMLATGLGYTRHTLNLRYAYNRGLQSIEVQLVAGLIYGRAPLFERFDLGDSSMLRGWNKFDLDPLGGNRLAYESVTYGYHIMRVFYDTGSVWDQGRMPEPKQSAGIGVSSGLGILQKGAFLLALAFPLRQGHAEPVLIAGMNF